MTGKPGVLQSMGSQRVRYNLATQQPDVSNKGWKILETKKIKSATVSTSVQFSHSVVSDSLRPNGLQHTRPACPSPTSGVYSNSCPLSP